MVYIAAALRAEARPWIDAFHLKQDHKHTAFPLYRGDDYTLIISGVGRINAAAACAYLLKLEASASDIVCNIGTAGSVSKALPIGEPFAIHRICDAAVKKEWYPDVLVHHVLRQAALTTVDQVARSCDGIENEMLIDMEAAGFFQTALRFVTCERIAVIKVVSDYIGLSIPSAEQIERQMSEALPLTAEALSKYASFGEKVCHMQDEQTLQALTQSLRLTQTQQQMLKKALKHYRLRTGRSFERRFEMCAATSRQRRDAFEQLKSELLAESSFDDLC